jgi:hypothetical protein
MKRSVGYLMALALLCGGAGKAGAGFVIDQSSTGPLGQGYNTSSSINLPLGQEFKPTLSSLDFVDLVLGDADTGIGSGASFQVKIHAGTITGTVLGISNTVTLPDGFNLAGGNEIYTHFTFAAPVALTPGATEVIEIVQLPPIGAGNDNFLMLWGFPERHGSVSGRRGRHQRQPGYRQLRL